MAEEIKKVVEYLVKAITRKPEEVQVEESEENMVLLEKIKVAPEDLPLVIGKGGRNIKAIRELVKVATVKQGRHAEIKLLD